MHILSTSYYHKINIIQHIYFISDKRRSEGTSAQRLVEIYEFNFMCQCIDYTILYS